MKQWLTSRVREMNGGSAVKRILAAMLMVTILFCSLSAPVSAETDAYANAIKNLYLYMKYQKESGKDIDNIVRDFTQLDNEGFSTELMLYAMMVEYIIVDDDLETAELYCNALVQMTTFTEYIEKDQNGLNAYMEKYCGTDDGTSGIVPVWQIQAYIEGRRAEKRGDMDAAREKYLQCISFYDARDRMVVTMRVDRQNGVDDKEAVFQEAMVFYTKGELEKAAMLLEQIKDAHTTAGAMYEVVINALASKSTTPTPKVTYTPEPTSTPTSTPTPTPTSKPTPTPTSKPTPTPTSKPTPTATSTPKATTVAVVYSDWVTEVPSGAQIVDTKTQYRRRSVVTEYRYRDLATKTSTESSLDGWSLVSSELVYGEWSAYTETPISASSTLEVEQSTKEVSKEVTVWNYSRWEYKHVDYPKLIYNSCVDYSKQNPSAVAEVYGWKYTSSTTRFTNMGVSGGCTKYKNASGALWYNETSSTKTETEQVTVYRSRTKTMKYTYQRWGSWSDWSQSSVSGSSTRQVETRQSYGSWSAWQDSALSANGGEVQTRTVYRYKIQG